MWSLSRTPPPPFFFLWSNIEYTQVLASILPPYPFKLSLFSICRGLLSRAILLYHLSDSHQVKTPFSFSFSFSFCVFFDPLNVCLPPVDLGDHTGVRPPQWWSRTTADVRGKEEKKKHEEKEVRRRAKRWGGSSAWHKLLKIGQAESAVLEWAHEI